MIYHAAPLPERELPSAEEIQPALREITPEESRFTFPNGELECTFHAWKDACVITVKRAASRSALAAFSQYLYEHPERRRAALIVIGGAELTEEWINSFIELFPDFPLLLPSGTPVPLRTYARERATLKGVTLL